MAATASAQTPAGECREILQRAPYDAALCFESIRDFASAAKVYREINALPSPPPALTARLAGIFLITGQQERALVELRRPPAQECTSAQSRQLDFWIGEWEIRSDGRPVGLSTVQPALGGCAPLEKGSIGAPFVSIAFYDPATGRWYRNLQIGFNRVFESSGEFTVGAVHLSGTRPERHRATLFANSMDEVRDRAESSGDDGATWTILHDFVYVRRK